MDSDLEKRFETISRMRREFRDEQSNGPNQSVKKQRSHKRTRMSHKKKGSIINSEDELRSLYFHYTDKFGQLDEKNEDILELADDGEVNKDGVDVEMGDTNFSIESTIFGGVKKSTLTFGSITNDRDFAELSSFILLDEKITATKRETGEIDKIVHNRGGLDCRQTIDRTLTKYSEIFSTSQFKHLVKECYTKIAEHESHELSQEEDYIPLKTNTELSVSEMVWNILETELKKDHETGDSTQHKNVTDMLLQCLVDPGTYDFSGPMSDFTEQFGTWLLVCSYNPIMILSRFDTPNVFFEYMWRLRKEQSIAFSEVFNGLLSRGWTGSMLLTNIETAFVSSFEQILYGFCFPSVSDIALSARVEKDSLIRKIQTWTLCAGVSISTKRFVTDYDLFDIFCALSLLAKSWRQPVLWGFVDSMGFSSIDEDVFLSTRLQESEMKKKMHKQRHAKQTESEETEIYPWLTWEPLFFQTLKNIEYYIRLLHARIVQLGGGLIFGGLQIDLRLVKHKEYYTYCNGQITWFLGVISFLETMFENSSSQWRNGLVRQCIVDKHVTQQPVNDIFFTPANSRKEKRVPLILTDIYSIKSKRRLDEKMFWDQSLKIVETLKTELINFCNYSASYGEMDNELVSLWEKISDPIDLKLMFMTRSGGSIGGNEKNARKETVTHSQFTRIFEDMKFPNGDSSCLRKLLPQTKDWIAQTVRLLMGVKLCYTRFHPAYSWVDENMFIDKDIFTNFKKVYPEESVTKFLSPEFLLLSDEDQNDRFKKTFMLFDQNVSCKESGQNKSHYTRKCDSDESDNIPTPSEITKPPYYILYDKNGVRKDNYIILIGCFYVLVSPYIFFISPVFAEVFMIWSALIDVFYKWKINYEIPYVAQDKTNQTRTSECNLMDGTHFTLNISDALKQGEDEISTDTSEKGQRKSKLIESTKEKIDTVRRGTKTLTGDDLQSGRNSNGSSGNGDEYTNSLSDRRWGAHVTGRL